MNSSIRIYLSLFVASIIFLASCGKDDGNAPDNSGESSPPTHINADFIVINNIGSLEQNDMHHFSVAIYSSDGVLLSRSESANLNSGLPETLSFLGQPDFSYNFKDYVLHFDNDFGNGDSTLATITLSLSEYDSSLNPQPEEMFYNKSGFAGTLHYWYTAQ